MSEVLQNLQEPLNQLIVFGVVLGFRSLGYFVRLLSGVKRVRKQSKAWNWSQFWDGVLDRTFWIIGAMCAIVACDMFWWLAPYMGMSFTAEFQSVVSAVAVIAIPFIAGANDLYNGIVGLKNTAGWDKNLKSLGMTEEDVDLSKADIGAIATETKKFVADVVTLLLTPKEAVKAHEQFEQEGGRGAYYVLDISSYDKFRAQVLGNGYDCDEHYGYQCWDGACLIWQQLGRSLITGDGSARGCWNLKRDINAGNDFELITSAKKIKRGDVVVFKMGTYGHIGFADQDYSNANYIPLLGQNQNGTPKHPQGGAGFNVVNISLNSFIGAFRFKKWNSATTAQNVSANENKNNSPFGLDNSSALAADTSQSGGSSANEIKEGDSVYAWGQGKATSLGNGGDTKDFSRRKMKVIMVANGRYGLNQYNQGRPGNATAVTGWWPKEQIERA